MRFDNDVERVSGSDVAEVEGGPEDFVADGFLELEGERSAESDEGEEEKENGCPGVMRMCHIDIVYRLFLDCGLMKHPYLSLVPIISQNTTASRLLPSSIISSFLLLAKTIF